MKNLIIRTIPIALAALNSASAQSSWTNYIIETRLATGVERIVSGLEKTGTKLSDQAITLETGSIQYDLHTVLNNPPATAKNYLLATRTVGLIPEAEVRITTSDPNGAVPRTRADQPFSVTITVRHLLNGAKDPIASKSVKFLTHKQEYGDEGTGVGLDRSQAILESQSSYTDNSVYTPTTPMVLPGLTKARGEQRYSIETLGDESTPKSILDSKYVVIWPVADATLTGIKDGDVIRGNCPNLTMTLNNLYPRSTTKLIYYKGERMAISDPRRTTPGVVLELPWFKDNTQEYAIDESGTLLGSACEDRFKEDGKYTIEMVTVTPFGTHRVKDIATGIEIAPTIEINRSMKVNGSFTTIK